MLNITRELDGVKEGHVDLLRTTLKRISNWKAQGHDGIHGFWFKKFTSIHDRLVLEMNRCLQDAQVPEWMTKGKTTLIQNDPSKGTAPNNYRPITYLPMMWKILTAHIREKIYYSLTSRGLFPDEQKGCRKGSRGTAELLYIDPKWEQNQTEKSSYGLDWLQKGIWYGPTKLDTVLSQNVQNITWNHKLYRKKHEDLESKANCRRKKRSWNKYPKRHFTRRCTITLTIHHTHDATEPHSQKMRSRIQTQQITREDRPPNVHG